MPPAAIDMIRENVEWLTPVAMVTKVQASFPEVSSAQVHRAWTQMSEIYWRRDEAQLLSAEKLLREYGDDVDLFTPTDIPEGVEMLCWGMKKIAGPLRGKVVEIGVDATYDTNSKHLELYSIMAEHEGAGFPISYLYLSTATSISQGKRKKALTAWAKCVRDTYGVFPKFTHVDKDMAEIGTLLETWNAKISLCWWHLRRAVRTRLSSGKLATTPYDAARARAEFSFIDLDFIPRGQEDRGEYEGGTHENVTPVAAASQGPGPPTIAPSGTQIRIPARDLGTQRPGSESDDDSDAGSGSDVDPDSDPVDGTETEGGTETDGGTSRTRSGRARKVPARFADAASPEAVTRAIRARAAAGKAGSKNTGTTASPPAEQEPEKKPRRFCPAEYRDAIINMMERHYCAHPLLPGYAHPSREGIKRWAVSQMYKFCVENDLPEVWAYLWENWYRATRWELWARSVHEEIPVLKTTMMLESHWRRIKHDFLHHFHMPRCDLVTWVLVAKMAPTYYRKLERLLVETGRYRELPCWRKDFKREWRKLEKRPITLPVNPAYKTDMKKGLCTCPAFAISRFLICKHVVQGYRRVPPVFFLEVKRQRTVPFWAHPSLRPAADGTGSTDADTTAMAGTDSDEDEPPRRAGHGGGGMSDFEDDDDDDDVVDTQKLEEDGQTFVEAMDDGIDTLIQFAEGLKYQRQFRDQRMLQALQREGASFLRLAKACLSKEKRSTRGTTPSTWDKSIGSAMFYRPRPPRREEMADGDRKCGV
ncbi:hypothetical protein FB45DRAFT_979820 [Roridomyces roridus]|uniref:SWIM-type domain-containing protein n=1 Tax=Roridomyces roridus TaxID=1738132 RepID=A0AAD7BND5_9AGAR|nr:hypothetical protein FB45DRAFT_979820 [Roridomyces roridus]